MLCLTINPNQPDACELQLNHGSTIVGRTLHPALALSRNLSRQHARIDVEDGSVRIYDLGSKNGTFVDGVRIEQQDLVGGEVIRCGETFFRFDQLIDDEPMDFISRRIDAGATRRSIDELTTALKRPQARRAPTGKATDDDGREQKKFQLLLKISEILSSPLGIDNLLETILDLVFSIMQVDRGAILAIDSQTGDLVSRAVKQDPRVPPSELTYSRNIVEHVRKHNVAVLFSNLQAHSELAQAKSVLSHGINSSMCAPMKPGDRFLGVIYVDDINGQCNFSEDDLDLLTAFANQAGVAIQNAELFKRLQATAVERDNLRRFFAPSTADRILKDIPVLGAIETEATVLFCDISGFTRLASQMQPGEIVAMLNKFLPAIAEVVFKYGGTLEKYIGDAVVAVWGAPFRTPDDADKALRAAVGMQRAVPALNEHLGEGQTLRIHLGLHTGKVAAGNIGSHRYMQYAVIGETTNLASRICNIAKSDEILLSNATLNRINADLWPVDEVGHVPIRGIDRPLNLHRLRWRDVEASSMENDRESQETPSDVPPSSHQGR